MSARWLARASLLLVLDTSDIAGLGHRARLDAGTLGIVAVTVGSAVQAAALLRGRA